MDVLNGDTSYISYRKTELVIGELFIPYQDKATSEDGTRDYYFELKSVAVGDFTFRSEQYMVVPFSYRVREHDSVDDSQTGGEETFNILMLYEDCQKTTLQHFRMPVPQIQAALKRGLVQMESLTFTQIGLDGKDTYRLNTQNVDRQVFHDSLILEYMMYDRERNVPFFLVIPYNLLNFLVRHATEKIESVELTLINLFDTLRKYLFLLLEGMQTFPWRLDDFLLHLSKREREKCVAQLLEKGYVNIDQLASISVALPQVHSALSASLSKNNRNEFEHRHRFYKDLDDEDWFSDVIYSLKIAIGYLLFHDGVKLESLDKFYSLRDNIENLTDIDLLESKPFDMWLQQADDVSLDRTIHACGIPVLACAFALKDYQPEILEKVLSKLSKSGTRMFQEEVDYMVSRSISMYEVNISRIRIVRVLRDIFIDTCFRRLVDSYPMVWWLQGIGEEMDLYRIYAAGGFPLFIKAFHGIPDLAELDFFFHALPEPAVNIIKKCVNEEYNRDERYNQQVVQSSQNEVIRIVLGLYISQKIQLGRQQLEVIEKVQQRT